MLFTRQVQISEIQRLKALLDSKTTESDVSEGDKALLDSKTTESDHRYPTTDEIGDCNTLKNLDLSFNMLTGDIPFSISKLKQLELLILKNNQLFGPIPSTLSQIPNLKILDLAQNRLNGEIPRLIYWNEAIRRANALEDDDVGALRKVSRQEYLMKKEVKKLEEIRDDLEDEQYLFNNIKLSEVENRELRFPANIGSMFWMSHENTIRHIFGYIFTNEKEVVDYVTKIAPLLCENIIMDSLQGTLSGNEGKGENVRGRRIFNRR